MPVYDLLEFEEGRLLLLGQQLFKLMPPELWKLVSDSFEVASYEFGETIYEEGGEPNALYVMRTGKARALKLAENGEEISLGLLGPDDLFGEQELLEDRPRGTTVRATMEASAFRLDRAVFNALLKNNPELEEYVELKVREDRLREFFVAHTAFARLEGEELKTLLSELEPVEFDAGEFVTRQGEPTGPVFVIEQGRLRVLRSVDGGVRDIAFLRRGDFFGDVSFLKGTLRGTSVQAVSACRLLRLGPETFGKLLDASSDFRTHIEERVAQLDYERVARVPLDFADEILPAHSGVWQAVSPDQVEQFEEAPAEPPRGRSSVFELPDGRFALPRQRIRKMPHVRQVDEADCGAACLAMVCRHFGRQVRLAAIRQAVHTSTDGTSLSGLVRGAEELGLAARGIKSSVANLDQLPLPAIVHWGGNHWAVVVDADDDSVQLADPGRSRARRIPRSELEENWTGYAALFAYTEDFERTPVGEPSIRWIWPFFQPHLKTLLGALGLAFAGAVLQAAVPVFTQIIVDDVLPQRDFSLLHLLMLSLLGVLLVLTVASLVRGFILSRMAVKLDSSTLDFLTGKLLALPMRYFHSRRTGDIERRLAGMQQVRRFIVQSGLEAMISVVTLLVALGVMLYYSLPLTGVFLATVPVYVVLMRVSSRRLRPVFETLEESLGRYQSHQIDAIRGIETVKALGAESTLRQKMIDQFDQVAGRRFRAEFTVLAYSGLVQLATILTLTLFLWIGALQVLEGNLTLGELVSFNSLIALANGPILALLSLWDQYQTSAVLLNRLADVLEQEPEQGEDHAALTPVKTLEGDIRLDGVGFRYGGPATPKVLDGISFHVAPGTKAAIVGRSGSGKTTLIKCLAGLIEPTEGAILYDRLDMTGLRYSDLRRQIGFVLQENYLFDDTIAANISLGEDDADLGRVVWAAEVANAREFVERLPLGYETKVGESGLLLSGGQRQRIAIARAVYHRPPVLIFDEATSALDSESERAVKESMDRLLEGRTSFVIAHRLSTIKDADVILVLEQGKLVEHGSHDELMDRRGLYFYLSSRQLEL